MLFRLAKLTERMTGVSQIVMSDRIVGRDSDRVLKQRGPVLPNLCLLPGQYRASAEQDHNRSR